MRALLVAAALLGLTACGGNTVSQVQAPTTFSVNGTITLVADSLNSEQAMGGACVTDGGYDDIRTGAQVSVRDEASKVIALGRLDAGHVAEQFTEGALVGYAYKCVFGFTVADVPEGHSIYSVEVSHRGELQYARADLNSALALSLGTS